MKHMPHPAIWVVSTLVVVATVWVCRVPPSGALADERGAFAGNEPVGHESRSNVEADGAEELEDECASCENDWVVSFEVERLEHEALKVRVKHLVDVAKNETHSAAYVLEELIESVESEDALPILQQAVSDTDQQHLRRMIQLKLIELHCDLDQAEEAREITLRLLRGK